MFFIIVNGVWALIHLYLGLRFIRPLRLGAFHNRLAWFGVLALFSFLPSVFFFHIHGNTPPWFYIFFWITFVNAGFTLILFPLTVFRDLGLVIQKQAARFIATRENKKVDPERRRFILNFLNLGVIGLSGSLTAIGYMTARKTPAVVRVDVPIKDLHDDLIGLKIAHITDTHISHAFDGAGLKRIVDKVNNLKPDIVSLTGDLVDGHVEEMKDHIKPIGDLKARHGVFFVTGNHEYYWNLNGWLNEIKNLGLIVLLNEHKVIEHRGAKILLAGVTDFRAGGLVPSHRSDPVAAIRGAPKCDVKIMLAHQPKSAPAVAKTGVDLQLSGHTHGGQFFPWNFVVPLFHPVGAGLTFFEGMWVYVSRGAGFWGPPIRLGAPSEITLVTLKRAGDKV